MDKRTYRVAETKKSKLDNNTLNSMLYINIVDNTLFHNFNHNCGNLGLYSSALQG